MALDDITTLIDFTTQLSKAVTFHHNSRIINGVMLAALQCKEMPEVVEIHRHKAIIAYRSVMDVIIRVKLSTVTHEEHMDEDLILTYSRFRCVVNEVRKYLLTINS